MEKEITEKSALLDSSSTKASSKRDVETSINQMKKSVQKLKDDVVALKSRRVATTESIEKCKDELAKYSGTPRKSTSVQIARAQSEQSNNSSTVTASKKSKK